MDRERRQVRDRRQGQDRRSDQEQDHEREAAQDQRQGAERTVALDLNRDEAKVRQLEGRWRAMKEAHPKWTHAFERHVDITEEQLARRAATGELPDHSYGEMGSHATKWQSGAAMAAAAHVLANTKEFKNKQVVAKADGTSRITIIRPLPDVLGPAWRANVYGRTAASHGMQSSQWNAASVVVGKWERRSDGQWHPVTCFPKPGP
jgi:hypothetical protein